MVVFLVAVLMVLWLYVTKRWLQRVIQAVILLLGGTQKQSVFVYTLVFLPGVIIHELTHFFSAAFLGVQTGDITLFPHEIDNDSDRVALGSVKIAKTDFFRSSIIGGAPTILGIVIVFILVNMFLGTKDFSQVTELMSTIMAAMRRHLWWVSALFMYLIWAVANTLFVSKEDTAAWPMLLIFFSLTAIILILAGLTGWASVLLPGAIGLAHVLAIGAATAAAINTLALGIGLGVQKVMEQLRHQKVVYH